MSNRDHESQSNARDTPLTTPLTTPLKKQPVDYTRYVGNRNRLHYYQQLQSTSPLIVKPLSTNNQPPKTPTALLSVRFRLNAPIPFTNDDSTILTSPILTNIHSN